jgi:cation:H+ antiporter
MLLLEGLWFIAGLAALVVGADTLVRGASKLALSSGLSPLVVGLTIVAFGTSAPEMAVSVDAVLGGQTDIAVGNVVGSNIFNVLFILGASALIVPLVVHIQLIRQEVPIMLGSSLLLVAFCLDGFVFLWEGIALLLALFAYTGFLVVQSRRQTAAEVKEYDEEIHPSAPGAWDSSVWVQLALVIGGLTLLVIGADWLVNAAVAFARAFGVSDLVIGLTIVAAGTSMPEVATSIAAALKGERDIAVGNVIGSNTFNVLGVVGLSGVAAGTSGLAIDPSVLRFDLWVMLAVSFACLPMFITGQEIGRWKGALFLFYYAAYVTYLILAAQQHRVIDIYSAAIIGFFIPLTIITLVVVWLKHPKG